MATSGGKASSDELLTLAKKHLLLTSSDAAVPQAYLDELKRHLNLYPHDINFSIEIQPGTGFGTVTCLEQSCNHARIPLTARVSKSDGGMKDGMGSLSAYRMHIADHPTHIKSRLARLKAEQASQNFIGTNVSQFGSPSVSSRSQPSQKARNPGLLSVLDASYGSSSCPNTTSSSFMSSSNPDRSATISSTPKRKLNPVLNPTSTSPQSQGHESEDLNITFPLTVARKRPSRSGAEFPTVDAGENGEKEAVIDVDGEFEGNGNVESTPPSAKKRKISLAPSNFKSVVSKKPVTPSASSSQPTVEDTRTLLKDVQTKISALQVSISRIQRRKRPSKGDATRLINLNAQMKKLKAEKERYNKMIPAAIDHSSTLRKSPLKARSKFELQHDQNVTGPSSSANSNADSKLGVLKGEQNQIKYEADDPGQNQGLDVVQSYYARVMARNPGYYAQMKDENAAMKQEPYLQQRHTQANALQPLCPSARNGNKDSVEDRKGWAKMNVDEKKLKFELDTKENVLPVASGSSSGQFGATGAHGLDFKDEELQDGFGPGEDGVVAYNGGGMLAEQRDDARFDQDGDFYGRGKDRFAGPIAKADDIDKFLLSAGNAEQFDGNASVDKALEKLRLRNLFEPMPGMEVALMPHQAIGVAWMLDKEKGQTKGGTMADEMGLGKTVQMMSVIVANRSDNPAYKTNLIVAPVALLDQWQLEIDMKTSCGLKCFIYHGSNKPKLKKDLMKYDIVLTTFATLAMEWPDEEAEMKEKAKKAKKSKKKDQFIETDSEDEKTAQKKKTKKKGMGLLFQINWWRIVLDEAQNIRNKRTRISRAITQLDAKYRWCLTGTPIINGLCDVYPMFRFLKIRPWYDWQEFNSHIGKYEKKNPTLATNRLQVIFASMLLRRKKDSMLDGQRLIDLPPKEVHLFKLQFTEEEREIYKMVEAKSQAVFNRFLRAGTVLKNYHQVLVLLLRLRQICSHPCLIYEDGGAYIEPGEECDDSAAPEARAELARARQLVSSDFVARMKFKFKQAVLQRIAAEKESADATAEEEECPICLDTAVDACVTPCTHIFCRECIINVLNTPHVDDPNNDIRYKADEHPCPACRSPVSKDTLFSRLAFEPTDEELAGGGKAKADDSDEEMQDVSQILKKRSKGKGKGRAARKRRVPYASSAEDDSDREDDLDDDQDDDLSDFIVEDDEDEEEKDARRNAKKRFGKARAIIIDSDDEEDDDVIWGKKKPAPQPSPNANGQIVLMSRFLPSTKMKHMMASLRQWAEEHPDEKTLIISQWTQCLQLVSDYLSEEGVLHVKYQGDMNRAKRDQAVRVFMAKDKAQVMLMSLKCGGVGLNLTRANRVISLDLGWSEAIESQAFDRVHRLGQNRDVVVHRLVIADTVEDRVLALQERKRNLADGSLGEGSGKKIGRLSVRELANLFGLDARGRVL